MRLFGKRTAALSALVLAAQISSASASETGCRVHSNLSSLILDSKNFLDYLRSGGVADAAWILDKRLKSSGTGDLPALLKQLDHDRFATTTETLILQQRSLLRTYKQSGRRSANQTADVIQARTQLNAVQRSLGTVVCTSSASKSYAGGGAGGGVSEMARSIAESGAFRLIAAMFLAGGVVVTLFGWFSQIGKRRTKRYSCLLPCTVVAKDKIHPAMITNISRTGAKLDIEKGFEKGQLVQVNFMGENAECRVVRHKNGQLAIDFNTMLHLEVLEKILAGVTAASLTGTAIGSSAGS